MHALSLLAFLLPLAAASTHAQCDCMSWSEGKPWIHDADLTQAVCESAFYKNKATYDPKTKRCVAGAEATKFWIDGHTWETQCKSFGQGYTDASGRPQKVGAAAGSCPDRP
ncbi:hypothetical protein E4U13_004911 [Claviceps humidiphila]|uniref:Uncharacterized protein n=1 Tax=Claviceps humidiphila TaxID=1294629 RepID=A0A9P7TVG2_9HYPO|nr:hypothetical protein E4U13_004911 [Claviceps humidiphila]